MTRNLNGNGQFKFCPQCYSVMLKCERHAHPTEPFHTDTVLEHGVLNGEPAAWAGGKAWLAIAKARAAILKREAR